MGASASVKDRNKNEPIRSIFVTKRCLFKYLKQTLFVVQSTSTHANKLNILAVIVHSNLKKNQI